MRSGAFLPFFPRPLCASPAARHTCHAAAATVPPFSLFPAVCHPTLITLIEFTQMEPMHVCPSVG